ncbi:Retrotrans gag domain-containing protein [Abeliophyllum distichum]|uniref:Retrotrans gag domain-containing protein n=1 Tax=Abeliophyllum distichum TaxID=126358 RepID=A0ABD1PE74_9LAMI
MPNKREMILYDNREVVTEDESDNDEMLELEDVGVEYPVEGEALVARRTVNAQIKEFEEVFPEKMPSILPPIRSFEHQIDFVSSAVIPNRPTYRSNQEETKEFQRQVEELMGKGYVRKIMRLCAVPVLLVPKKDGTWRICIDCKAVNDITLNPFEEVGDDASHGPASKDSIHILMGTLMRSRARKIKEDMQGLVQAM